MNHTLTDDPGDADVNINVNDNIRVEESASTNRLALTANAYEWIEQEVQTYLQDPVV